MRFSYLVNTDWLLLDTDAFHGIFSNPRFLILMACIMVVQVIVIMFAGDFMYTDPMGGRAWGFTMLFVLPSIAWGWVIRFAIRIWERRSVGKPAQH